MVYNFAVVLFVLEMSGDEDEKIGEKDANVRQDRFSKKAKAPRDTGHSFLGHHHELAD